MILVLLGTFNVEFKRPLRELEKLCLQGKISEEIIVQNGYTKYTSRFFKMFAFVEPKVLDQLYDDARIVITHAGTGSIIKGLKKGKKVIAIPRLKKNREMVDDHQLEILNEFALSGYIVPWNEHDSLEHILIDINFFRPKVYISQNDKILTYLKDYIDNL